MPLYYDIVPYPTPTLFLRLQQMQDPTLHSIYLYPFIMRPFSYILITHNFPPPRLSHRMMKGGPVPRRVFVQVEAKSDREAHYTVPTGILFLKATKGEVLHTLLSQCCLFYACLSIQPQLCKNIVFFTLGTRRQSQCYINAGSSMHV